MPRRRQPRFWPGDAWDGSLRILNDVELEGYANGEFQVVGDTPRGRGELLTLDLVGSQTAQRLKVRVVDSKPFVADAGIRHRMRLAVVDEMVDADR